MSCRPLGPPGAGPKLKPGVNIIGAAAPFESSGFTLVKPSSAGVLEFVGVASLAASRFADARNSFTQPRAKECVHVRFNTWLRTVSANPEPSGTLPPVDAPLLI